MIGASETFTDVRLSWYEASSGERSPSLAHLERYGKAPCDDPLHVFLPCDHPNYDRMLALRDWLKRHDCDYTLLGRFGIQAAMYETRRRRIGLVFVFRDQAQCALFITFHI